MLTELVVAFLAHTVVADQDGGCLHWTGTLSHGYGKCGPRYGSTQAHRAAYLLFVGAIPADHEIDHVCHTAGLACVGLGDECLHRRCVNPLHLRAVSVAVNRAAKPPQILKSHCVKGHPYSGENLYVNPKTGARACRSCTREAAHRWRAKADNSERDNARRAMRCIASLSHVNPQETP